MLYVVYTMNYQRDPIQNKAGDGEEERRKKCASPVSQKKSRRE
jgi:hypothetical protein